MTPPERMAAMRKRQADAGKFPVSITLPAATIKALDRLRSDQSRSEYVAQLINAQAKAKARQK